MFLKSAYEGCSSHCARRVNFAVQITSVLYPCLQVSALASTNLQSRFVLLAAIGMSASQPLLKMALVIRNDEGAVDALRRAFPYHRKLVVRVFRLADVLSERIPINVASDPWGRRSSIAAPSFSTSRRHLEAAERAMAVLGPNAARHKPLSQAMAFLK